jgi:hypothetical protein
VTDRSELTAIIDAILSEEASIATMESQIAISRILLAQLGNRRAKLSAAAGVVGQGTISMATMQRLAELRKARGED